MKDISLKAAIESLKIERDAVNDVLTKLDKEAFAKAVDAVAYCD